MRIILFVIVIWVNIIKINFGQTVVWSNFYNELPSSQEAVADVSFDQLGNTYLLGYGRIVTIQSYDFILIKSNENGEKEWSKVFNGTQNDNDLPSALFVDATGNVYVTGITRWLNNTYKIVTLKYSASGNLLWSTVFDSTGVSESRSNDISVSNDGFIYVTGYASPNNNGYYDLVTLKLSNDGEILDWNYFGQSTNSSDNGSIVITDNNGNVIVGGDSFRNTTFGREAVIIKYNSSLDTSWVHRINGNDNSFNEFTTDLAVDDTGNVYTLCRLQNNPGFTDYAVIKINSSGEILWRKEFDEAGAQDLPQAMCLDNDGNVIVTGTVRRIGSGGYNDFAVIKYNNAGERQWISYYDGPNNLDDDPINIGSDIYRNIYICGESNRTGGNFKFITAKYNPEGSFIWEYVYDENVSSKAIAISTEVNGYVYAAGEGENTLGNQNMFAVKLSNVTGIEKNLITLNDYYLLQNYPNPFNPSTKISWQSPVSGHQSLKVYDVLGNEVATLVDEYKSAGSYEVDFIASELPSGVYIYKLQSGDFIKTMKMILLK